MRRLLFPTVRHCPYVGFAVEIQSLTTKLKANLLRRGSSDKTVDPAIQLAVSKTRENCCYSNGNGSRIPLFVTFHPHLLAIRSITNSHHHLLQLSNKMTLATPDPPILAFRCPKYLPDLLVSAEVIKPSPTNPGNISCSTSNLP